MNGMFLNGLKSARQIFWEEGLLFYPRLFEGEELARLSEACERIYQQNLAECRDDKPGAVEDMYSMRHLNHPRFQSEDNEDWKLILETAADPRCLGPVEQIFGGESLFYTTSLFFNPLAGRKSGDWHRDQQFVSPNEEAVQRHFAPENLNSRMSRAGIQLQIALVDNDDIEYVPFSAARYDSPEEYHYRCADGRSHNREEGMPNAMRVHQRAGDAMAFNPEGLHRGRYHNDIPRRTLMLTYTPRNSPLHNTYFSNQPWMMEPGHLDGLSGRARAFYGEFIDTYRDTWLQI